MFGFSEGAKHRQPMECNDKQGASIDLTSATGLQATVYTEPREGAIVSATYNVANDGIVVDSAVNGLITVVFDTDDLTAGEYIIEVVATLASGDLVLLRRDWFRVFGSHAL